VVGFEAGACDGWAAGLGAGCGAGAEGVNEELTALRQALLPNASQYSCWAMGIDWSMVWLR
jgi:hypothetical protein